MGNQKLEIMSEILHNWYLEATKKLDKKHYNSKAQKKYNDLTKKQKSIDRYIANKILNLFETPIILQNETTKQIELIVGNNNQPEPDATIILNPLDKQNIYYWDIIVIDNIKD